MLLTQHHASNKLPDIYNTLTKYGEKCKSLCPCVLSLCMYSGAARVCVWKMCHKIWWHVQQQLQALRIISIIFGSMASLSLLMCGCVSVYTYLRVYIYGSFTMVRSSSPFTLIYCYIACLGYIASLCYSTEECKLQTPLNRFIWFGLLFCLLLLSIVVVVVIVVSSACPH